MIWRSIKIQCPLLVFLVSPKLCTYIGTILQSMYRDEKEDKWPRTYYALLCKQLQFVIVLSQLLHLRCSTKDHMLCTSYKVVISNYNCVGKKQEIPFSPRPELWLVPQISFARFLKNQFTSSYTGFIHPACTKSDRKPINTGAQLQGTLVSLETDVVKGGCRRNPH